MAMHEGKKWAVLVCALAIATGSQPASAAPSKSVFLEDLTTAELKDRIAQGCPVALVYNASVEETGPHVALGKHIFRARAYGEALAHEMGDAIVAPVLAFAPAGTPSEKWPGTISLSSPTYSRVNEEVVRSLIGGGFKRIALLNDHGGGQTELRDLALKLDAEFAPRGVRTFFISDSYARARMEIEADIRASGKVASGHGGLWDTAETMAVRPSAVRPEKFHPGTLEQEGNGPPNAEGFSGDPTGSSQPLGRKFGALRVRLAAAELRSALSTAGACGMGVRQ